MEIQYSTTIATEVDCPLSLLSTRSLAPGSAVREQHNDAEIDGIAGGELSGVDADAKIVSMLRIGRGVCESARLYIPASAGVCVYTLSPEPAVGS